MSYFMTICGEIIKKDFDDLQIEVFPAKEAQKYIVDLIPQIQKADGKPVWFVHDGETFTSDILISDLINSLWMEEPYQDQNFYKLLSKCFEKKWNFRIWLANNGPNDFENNSEPVSSLKETLEALKERKGVYYQHKEI